MFDSVYLKGAGMVREQTHAVLAGYLTPCFKDIDATVYLEMTAPLRGIGGEPKWSFVSQSALRLISPLIKAIRLPSR